MEGPYAFRGDVEEKAQIVVTMCEIKRQLVNLKSTQVSIFHKLLLKVGSYRGLEFLLLYVDVLVDLAGIVPQDTRIEDLGLVFGEVSQPKESCWAFS
jgi:hypothetical protein